MSAVEYGTYSGPALEGERLHRCLIDLQDSTIRKHHLKRPSLSLADYEDLYARAMLVLLEKHPDASFPAPQAVIAWLDTTIARSAIDVLRRRNLGRETNDVVSVTDSSRSDDEPNVVQPVDFAPTPEQHVLLDEDRLTLKEFIASLDPEDRKISLLHLHPGSRMKLKQIAQALDLPAPQVNTVLKRVDKRFSRYIALEVDAVCALRQRDLASWKRTGEMPAALRWHARRCSTCSAKIDEARTEVYRSVLPVAGAVGLPVGGAGFFSRLYHSVGSRPAAVRANHELSCGRKAGAVSAGGSGALISAKAVVVGAVGAVAVAGAGVAVVHSIGNRPPPAHPTPAVRTTAAHLIVGRPSMTATPRTTTTTTKTITSRTKAARASQTPRRSTSHITTSNPAVSAPRTTVSKPAVVTPAASKPEPADSPTPVSAGHMTSSSSTATSKKAPAHASSSTSGGLPDLQQTQQQP